jgi:3-methyladenine DNA glycosylase AlkC
MKKTTNKKPTASSTKKSKKPAAAKPNADNSSTRSPRTMADVPPAMRAQLNAGTREARTLVEILVIDFAKLLASLDLVPKAALEAMRDAEGPGPLSKSQGKRLGITQRMELAGTLLDQHARPHLPTLANHTSDTIRGWTAYALARREGLTLAQRLSAMRPFADDPNPGVREWAWIAARPAIVAAPLEAINLLTPWTRENSANVRRFATESTRPRGVWCAHIDLLKREPAHALPLLEPLRADPSRYVQNSVANWLNDASKHDPKFVKQLTTRWLRDADSDRATTYICNRATRSME